MDGRKHGGKGLPGISAWGMVGMGVLGLPLKLLYRLWGVCGGRGQFGGMWAGMYWDLTTSSFFVVNISFEQGY